MMAGMQFGPAFATAAIIIAIGGVASIITDRPSAQSTTASPSHADKLEPPGSLFEGCRISWGRKLCGEAALRDELIRPVAAIAREEQNAGEERIERSCVATPAKFSLISTKLSLPAIRQIMRCEGELINETRVNFVAYKTSLWRGQYEGTGVLVSFYGNRADSITQMGLGGR